jgi:hypothetical protein
MFLEIHLESSIEQILGGYGDLDIEVIKWRYADLSHTRSKC